MSEEQPTTPMTPTSPARPRFQDRVWDLRTVVVVAVVALLLGGGVGAAVASAGGHDQHERFGPGKHGRFGMHQKFQPGGPMMMPPGQQFGQQFGQPFGQGQKGQRREKLLREFKLFKQWEREQQRSASPSPSAQG